MKTDYHIVEIREEDVLNSKRLAYVLIPNEYDSKTNAGIEKLIELLKENIPNHVGRDTIDLKFQGTNGTEFSFLLNKIENEERKKYDKNGFLIKELPLYFFNMNITKKTI